MFCSADSDTRYEEVVEACALRPDIEILPDGDRTEIGEKVHVQLHYVFSTIYLQCGVVEETAKSAATLVPACASLKLPE